MNTPTPANSNGRTIAASGHTAFEVGTTYATRSICDSECIFSFKIIKRTAKSVWIAERGGAVVRKGLDTYNGVEQFKPFGSYSMCAIIGADRKLVEG